MPKGQNPSVPKGRSMFRFMLDNHIVLVKLVFRGACVTHERTILRGLNKYVCACAHVAREDDYG